MVRPAFAASSPDDGVPGAVRAAAVPRWAAGGVGMRSALAGFVVWVRPLQNLAVMLADQVTARQIERVDRMERDDERYPTTVEGSVRLIDSY